MNEPAAASVQPHTVTADDDLSKDAHRQAFPVKLHQLLEDAEKHGFSHIVSWKSDTSFMVYDSDAFVQKVAPNYFCISKYKSFQRQLSLYGFGRVTSGKKRGLRFHDKFVRGVKETAVNLKPLTQLMNEPSKKAKSAAARRVSISSFQSSSSITSTTQQYFAKPDFFKGSPLSTPPPMLVSPQSSPTARPVISDSDDEESMGFFEGKSFFLMEDESSDGPQNNNTAIRAFSTPKAAAPAQKPGPLVCPILPSLKLNEFIRSPPSSNNFPKTISNFKLSSVDYSRRSEEAVSPSTEAQLPPQTIHCTDIPAMTERKKVLRAVSCEEMPHDPLSFSTTDDDELHHFEGSNSVISNDSDFYDEPLSMDHADIFVSAC